MVLSNRFRIKAAAAVMALAMVFTPAAFANDGANTTAAEVTPSIEFYPDAQREANRWVVDSPDRIAVSITQGTGTNPQIIQNISPIISGLFEKENIDASNVTFFFEKGNGKATALMIHTDEYVTKPFALNIDSARENVKNIASRVRFDPIKNTSRIMGSKPN